MEALRKLPEGGKGGKLGLLSGILPNIPILGERPSASVF